MKRFDTFLRKFTDIFFLILLFGYKRMKLDIYWVSIKYEIIL